MNMRTTVILLIVVVAVGVFAFFVVVLGPWSVVCGLYLRCWRAVIARLIRVNSVP